MPWRRVLAVVVVVVVAGSLSSCTAKPPPNALRIPTVPQSGGTGGRLALLAGDLGGSTASGFACMWVSVGAQKTLVQWPHGWWAVPSPLRIVNSNGHVVATYGDRVELGGAALPSTTKFRGCAEGADGAFVAWTVKKVAH